MRDGGATRGASGRAPLAVPALLGLLTMGSVRAADELPGRDRVERGPVTAEVSVEPQTVAIGDPVVLTLEVAAEPGVELLMPEFGRSLERFRILDFVPGSRIDDDGRTVETQRYTLETVASGRQAIPTLGVEFVDRRSGRSPAPEGEDAYELLTPRVGFEVTSVLPGEGAAALEPPLGALAPRATLAERSSPYAGAGLVVALVLLAGWWLWRRARRRPTLLSAHASAVARLARLGEDGLPGLADRAALDRFFVALSDLVRRYLEDAFGLHAPELTTEEFLDVAAHTPDLTDEHRRFLRDFLRRADQVKFSAHPPDDVEPAAALAAVRAFLEETRPRDEAPRSGPEATRA